VSPITASVREIIYPQFTPTRVSFFKVPPVGIIIALLVYLSFVMGLEYFNNFIPGAQHYEAFGLRAGLLTVAQLPLLILLAGKNNLIGLVTGVTYERLNVFHRWVARTMLLTATLHGGYQIYGWSRYGLVVIESQTDACWPRGNLLCSMQLILLGFATWSILLWMNVSTLAPIRNWYYEIFVIQHLLTFFGFIIAVMLHIPIFFGRYLPIFSPN
jgi:ferric-chelate reductase